MLARVLSSSCALRQQMSLQDMRAREPEMPQCAGSQAAAVSETGIQTAAVLQDTATGARRTFDGLSDEPLDSAAAQPGTGSDRTATLHGVSNDITSSRRHPQQH